MSRWDLEVTVFLATFLVAYSVYDLKKSLTAVCDKLDEVNGTLKDIKSDLSELTSSVFAWTKMNP
jgi:hypothetical protein